MKVVPVPMLSDNYAYLLIANDGTTAAVDPVEPVKVISAAEKEGVKISSVLTTHHHWDHAGGNEEMAKRIPGIQIIGGEHDKVAAANKEVADKQRISLGSISIQCIETPFHTQGHICYLCSEEGSSEKLVFTGDTLFIGGCGRCFVGTPQQMYDALVGKLSKLDPDVKVWCGHEYTIKNLEFAADADKENKAVQEKLQWAKTQRSANKPTIPSTIGDELQTNPFLRPEKPALQAYAGAKNPVEVLGILRKKKNSF